MSDTTFRKVIEGNIGVSCIDEDLSKESPHSCQRHVGDNCTSIRTKVFLEASGFNIRDYMRSLFEEFYKENPGPSDTDREVAEVLENYLLRHRKLNWTQKINKGRIQEYVEEYLLTHRTVPIDSIVSSKSVNKIDVQDSLIVKVSNKPDSSTSDDPPSICCSFLRGCRHRIVTLISRKKKNKDHDGDAKTKQKKCLRLRKWFGRLNCFKQVEKVEATH